MPEGPTLHKLARDHTALLGGQKIAVSSPQGRFEEAAKTIDGLKLTKVEAWGKHIFYDFAKGRVLHIHLGLYGKYRVYDNPPPEPRGAVRVRLTGKTHTLDLNGPNQCEIIDATARDEILARLGPDLLRADADKEKAWQRIHTSRQSIGQLLMDQAVISGIGNIYRAELLWRIKLHPKTPGKAVTREQFDVIWADSQRLMEFAVHAGHIYTTDKYAAKAFDKLPAKPSRTQRFNIYKNDACPRCKGGINQYTLAGRTVYACDGCQVVQAETSE